MPRRGHKKVLVQKASALVETTRPHATVTSVAGLSLAGTEPKRETYTYMTKYERAHAIWVRILQLSGGAPPLIDITHEKNAHEIARKELKAGVLPLVVRRKLVDDTQEDWPIALFKPDPDVTFDW